MGLFQKFRSWYKYQTNPQWTMIWYLTGEWLIHSSFGKDSKYCSFSIYYSKIRKKYKLVCKGYDPENHPRYKNAIDQLIKINKRGICT